MVGGGVQSPSTWLANGCSCTTTVPATKSPRRLHFGLVSAEEADPVQKPGKLSTMRIRLRTAASNTVMGWPDSSITRR